MAKPGNLEELGMKLLDAYAVELDEYDKRRELWSARQEIGEDVWGFLDKINELEEEAEHDRGTNKQEREKVKCTIFAKGIRNRQLGVDLKQKIEEGKIKHLEDAGKLASIKLRSMREDIQRGKENSKWSTNRREDTRDNSKDFKGKCWKCGKFGHLSQFCKGLNANQGDTRRYEPREEIGEQQSRYGQEERQNNAENFYPRTSEPEGIRKFSGECWICGRTGHPAFKCWFKERGQNETRYENERRNIVRRVDEGEEEEINEQGNI